MFLDSNNAISNFCSETSDMLRLVGWIITIFKIAIPLVIIVLGMIDFGKAVVSDKDDDIKKNAKTLGRRALAGLVIFFVPSIVVWLFGAIVTGSDTEGDTGYSSYTGKEGKFYVCQECILHPSSDDCK